MEQNMGFSGRAGWGKVEEMRGLRAVLAGWIWAAAMAAAGEGIPLYREWDTAVRFDGMESGEIGVDEEMRRELRAGPIREGIMGKELVVDLTGGGRSGVKVVGGTPEMWKGGTVNSGNDRESKKKEDDGWILSAIRQADGSSSNRTSLGTWLAGEGDEQENGWGWLAGGVQADAEGRAAEQAAAWQEESQDWGVGEMGNGMDAGKEGGKGGGAESGERGQQGMGGESTVREGVAGAAGMAGAGWRTEERGGTAGSVPGQGPGGAPGGGTEEVAGAGKAEGEGGAGEMSRTRAALEMAGMKTDVWKPEGGDRRFATEGLGADWKALTAGASGGALAGGPGGDGGSGGEGVGSGRSGGGAGGEPSRARAGSGWSMPSAAESGRGWSMGSAPGHGESGGWSFGGGGASGAGGSGLPGMGQGVESRERWGGGWVVGGGAGGGGFGSGIGGGAGAGSGWGGYRSQVDAGGGVSVPAQRSGGGAAWEAWQKRGENSGGGFTPVWR